MYERSGWGRFGALAMLAGALAWSPPSFGVEANPAMEATPSDEFVDPTVYHTVEPGETLSAIAIRYGTSIDSLIRENQIADTKKIWVGTRLRIPANDELDPTLDAEDRAHTEKPKATEISTLLDRCEAELRAARFEQALASAAEVRDWIEAREGAADDSSRVRLEIASATAYVALGQHDAALESLERALATDPDLELDPALTSPKVLAVFRAARGRPAPPR
jgi:LysM repeat protein